MAGQASRTLKQRVFVLVFISVLIGSFQNCAPGIDLNVPPQEFASNSVTTPTVTPTLSPTVTPAVTPAVTPTPATGNALSIKDVGVGNNRVVTVEADKLFRLVFEAADNWGLAQWYDLVNDPQGLTNIAAEPGGVPRDVMVAEPALFQQVYYGTNPDDPKLYTRSAYYFFPNSPRSFVILENSPSRVIVEATSIPAVSAQGTLDNVTVTVRYNIYPNGKIYIKSHTAFRNAQSVSAWRCAVLGLSDPADPATGLRPDKVGWSRATSTQNPYDYVGGTEKYIYAYWNPQTPAPYTNFTKASILLVPRPGNPYQGKQGTHGWPGFKRWYYGDSSLNMAAGSSIDQEYLMQLGAKNSSVLPDLVNSSVADPIANSYIANPNPP